MLQINGETLDRRLDRDHRRARGAPSRTRRSIPSDPEQRRRALDLEEYFDENLGPQIRLLVWHELRRDPERMADLDGADGASAAEDACPDSGDVGLSV